MVSSATAWSMSSAHIIQHYRQGNKTIESSKNNTRGSEAKPMRSGRQKASCSEHPMSKGHVFSRSSNLGDKTPEHEVWLPDSDGG